MPTTPVLALPYPVFSSTDQIPADIQALAERMDLLFGFTKLAEAVLGSDQASPWNAFSSIPQTHTHLLIVARMRSSAAVANSPQLLRYNGNTGTPYDDEYVRAAGASNSSVEAIARSLGARVFSMPGNSAPANHFGAAMAWIADYRDATKQKIAAEAGGSPTGTATGTAIVDVNASNYRNLEAITSLSFVEGNSGSYKAGSKVSLYGFL